MALREYRCSFCGESRLAFDNEKDYRLYTIVSCPGCLLYNHAWERQPPRVTVVLATTGLMLDEPQLDSLITIYELDRQLNMEARDEIEMEIYQRARRNA